MSGLRSEQDDLVDLDALDALDASATEAPWAWEHRRVDSDGYVYIPQGSTLGETMIMLNDVYEGSANDCDLLAELRNKYRALSAELRHRRSLPVIATCIDCRHPTFPRRAAGQSGGSPFCGRDPSQRRLPTDSTTPPSWCPLRGGV